MVLIETSEIWPVLATFCPSVSWRIADTDRSIMGWRLPRFKYSDSLLLELATATSPKRSEGPESQWPSNNYCKVQQGFIDKAGYRARRYTVYATALEHGKIYVAIRANLTESPIIQVEVCILALFGCVV